MCWVLSRSSNEKGDIGEGEETMHGVTQTGQAHPAPQTALQRQHMRHKAGNQSAALEPDVHKSLVHSQIIAKGLCFVQDCFVCVWRSRGEERGGNQLNNEYNSQTGSLCFLQQRLLKQHTHTHTLVYTRPFKQGHIACTVQYCMGSQTQALPQSVPPQTPCVCVCSESGYFRRYGQILIYGVLSPPHNYRTEQSVC